MNTITMNGAGKILPVFLPICADWWMPLLVYESFYRNLPVSKYNQTEQTYGPNELHDVAYYNRMKFAKIDEQYDIDSPDDFIWFAKDHYGELGLSRLNIFASDTERSGWVIVVSNSYSANAGLAIEVATALYKSGVPLIIHDADKLLKILEEEDYVTLPSAPLRRRRPPLSDSRCSWNGTRLTPSTICLRCWPTAGRA